MTFSERNLNFIVCKSVLNYVTKRHSENREGCFFFAEKNEFFPLNSKYNIKMIRLVSIFILPIFVTFLRML